MLPEIIYLKKRKNERKMVRQESVSAKFDSTDHLHGEQMSQVNQSPFAKY